MKNLILNVIWWKKKNKLHRQALNCVFCRDFATKIVINYHTKRHSRVLPRPQASLVDSHAGALSSGADAFRLPLIKSLASYFPAVNERDAKAFGDEEGVCS